MSLTIAQNRVEWLSKSIFTFQSGEQESRARALCIIICMKINQILSWTAAYNIVFLLSTRPSNTFMTFMLLRLLSLGLTLTTNFFNEGKQYYCYTKEFNPHQYNTSEAVELCFTAHLSTCWYNYMHLWLSSIFCSSLHTTSTRVSLHLCLTSSVFWSGSWLRSGVLSYCNWMHYYSGTAKQGTLWGPLIVSLVERSPLSRRWMIH